MTISMYRVSVPVFLRMLDNLTAFLKKGEAFAKESDINEEEFLGGSLAPDMFNLTRQIQIVSDVSKGCVSRLAGQEIPSYEDNEKTFAELYARIDKTREHLNSFTPDQIDNTEEKTITLKLPDREISFPGLFFLTSFALPNFYFHVTTAYNILRHSGVEIGKMDFLGNPPNLSKN